MVKKILFCAILFLVIGIFSACVFKRDSGISTNTEGVGEEVRNEDIKNEGTKNEGVKNEEIENEEIKNEEIKNEAKNETGDETRVVKLFYYNSSRDLDASGNIRCSRNGLVAVEREISITITPIQDTLKLLMRGELGETERANGLTTEFPLSGVELAGAALNNGVLTLNFSDPNNRTSGGSCRAGILWAQIAATAEQFPEVASVRFQPEELFQP